MEGHLILDILIICDCQTWLKNVNVEVPQYDEEQYKNDNFVTKHDEKILKGYLFVWH